MKKYVVGIFCVLIVVIIMACITGLAEDTWDWHSDSRVRSEYDESGFGFYGIDEWVYIGSDYIIYIHYKPDLSGGWCEWCQFDEDGNEWLKEKSEDLNMKDLGRRVETWGTFMLAKLDLENDTES